MNLIDVNIITLDKTYPATIDADALVTLVKMPKYTYAEMVSGSKYHLKETPNELMKKMAACQKGQETAENAPKRQNKTRKQNG